MFYTVGGLDGVGHVTFVAADVLQMFYTVDGLDGPVVLVTSGIFGCSVQQMV